MQYKLYIEMKFKLVNNTLILCNKTYQLKEGLFNTIILDSKYRIILHESSNDSNKCLLDIKKLRNCNYLIVISKPRFELELSSKPLIRSRFRFNAVSKKITSINLKKNTSNKLSKQEQNIISARKIMKNLGLSEKEINENENLEWHYVGAKISNNLLDLYFHNKLNYSVDTIYNLQKDFLAKQKKETTQKRHASINSSVNKLSLNIDLGEITVNNNKNIFWNQETTMFLYNSKLKLLNVYNDDILDKIDTVKDNTYLMIYSDKTNKQLLSALSISLDSIINWFAIIAKTFGTFKILKFITKKEDFDLNDYIIPPLSELVKLEKMQQTEIKIKIQEEKEKKIKLLEIERIVDSIDKRKPICIVTIGFDLRDQYSALSMSQHLGMKCYHCKSWEQVYLCYKKKEIPNDMIYLCIFKPFIIRKNIIEILRKHDWDNLFLSLSHCHGERILSSLEFNTGDDFAIAMKNITEKIPKEACMINCPCVLNSFRKNKKTSHDFYHPELPLVSCVIYVDTLKHSKTYELSISSILYQRYNKKEIIVVLTENPGSIKSEISYIKKTIKKLGNGNSNITLRLNKNTTETFDVLQYCNGEYVMTTHGSIVSHRDRISYNLLSGRTFIKLTNKESIQYDGTLLNKLISCDNPVFDYNDLSNNKVIMYFMKRDSIGNDEIYNDPQKIVTTFNLIKN